jgi:primosomal protein N'
MRYIAVVPSMRTPSGVEVFDYRINETHDVRVGDLILVPFRKNNIPALVVSVSPTSAFADRVRELETINYIFRFPAVIVPLLDRTASLSFVSKPTVLMSWLRHVPKRYQTMINTSPNPSSGRRGIEDPKRSTDITEYVVNRFERVIERAKQQQGRVLVLTPWQNRAELFGRKLDSLSLHAGLPDSQAWSALTNFINSQSSILVATRIGAWLSAFADVVIIDEPENDDFKQDESSPRIDARRIVEIANEYRPNLTTIRVGVTPPLSDQMDAAPASIPNIEVPTSLLPWHWQARGEIEGLNSQIAEKIEAALNEKRNVIILHPIRGERSRFTCKDCAWTLMCAFCGSVVTRKLTNAQCGRCGKSAPLPESCPNCQGTNLRGGRAGNDHVARRIQETYGGDKVTVVNLSDWHKHSLSHGSLVIVSDFSLIGGHVEDIRRRERLLISFRRLSAAVALAKGELILQGPEDLLQKAMEWLIEDGVKSTWVEELKERKTFGYPPSAKMIKCLLDGSTDDAEQFVKLCDEALPETWKSRGPYEVTNRVKTKKPRHVIHLFPPQDADEGEILSIMETFTKQVIIDLDPIAFFS